MVTTLSMIFGCTVVAPFNQLNSKILLQADIDILPTCTKDICTFLGEWIKIKKGLMTYRDLIFRLPFGVE